MQQECIPVGCVPTAAVATTRCQYKEGLPPGRGVGWLKLKPFRKMPEMGFQARNEIPRNKKALEQDAYLPLAGRMCFGGHRMSVLVGKGGALTVRSSEQVWTGFQWSSSDVMSHVWKGGGAKPNPFPWICTLGYSNLAGLPTAKPKTVFTVRNEVAKVMFLQVRYFPVRWNKTKNLSWRHFITSCPFEGDVTTDWIY